MHAMKYVRCTLSVLVGLAFVVPWTALSAVGLACLYSADFIERVKDFLQDKAIGPYGLVVAAALFAPAAFASAELRVPPQPVPASQYRDTETTVFVPLTNGIPSQAEFAVDVSFVPTMSNNVEVAFGEDRDRNGRLSFPETDVVFGLDCGRFFFERVQTGERHEYEGYDFSLIEEGDVIERTTIRYSCTLDGIGNPPSGFYMGMANKWADWGDDDVAVVHTNGTWYGYVSANSANLWAGTYGGQAGEAWPWRSAWNLMRVTRRGSHASDPSGSFAVRQRGGVIQMQ